MRRGWLVGSALWELGIYDLRLKLFGFRSVYRSTGSVAGKSEAAIRDVALEADIQHAVRKASCLYIKPVQCLQRSIVAARLMRRRRLQPLVKIGFCADPFFAHAWLELNGEVVGDSATYKRKLQIIDTI